MFVSDLRQKLLLDQKQTCVDQKRTWVDQKQTWVDQKQTFDCRAKTVEQLMVSQISRWGSIIK